MAFEHLDMPDTGMLSIWEEWGNHYLTGVVKQRLSVANTLDQPTIFVDDILPTVSADLIDGHTLEIPLAEHFFLGYRERVAEVSRLLLSGSWVSGDERFCTEIQFFDSRDAWPDDYTEGLRLDPDGRAWHIRPPQEDTTFKVRPTGYTEALLFGYRMSRMNVLPYMLDPPLPE